MTIKNSFHIFAVSDATGELAHNLALSASRQFEGLNVKIWRRSRVKSEEQIRKVIAETKEKDGVILFTMVSNDIRRLVLAEAKKESVVAMDVMGPALDMLSHYFHKLPSDEPGLQYRDTRDYFHRMEAIEYAVRHDDGHGLDGLDQANIILVGISRTSKTPISIYLAYLGHRCANFPIVNGMPLPTEIKALDPKKIIGLTMAPENLMLRRHTRLKKMGRPETEDYAQRETVEKELAYAQEIFGQLGNINVVDVSGKAIEEIASEILHARSLKDDQPD